LPLGNRCGREFDSHDLLERVFAGDQDRATHSRADVDERCVAHECIGNARQHLAQVGDRNGLVVRNVRVGFAAAIVVELAQQHHGVRRDAVLVIEPASARALRIGHRAPFDGRGPNNASP
jgi:hypothetical protein